MREIVESIARTAVGAVEVVFYIDTDDHPSIEQIPFLQEVRDDVFVLPVIGPRITMSDTWNHCANASTGEILMLCCDQVLFHTPCWDQMVQKAFAQWPDRIGLVYGEDGIHHGNAATLPFLHRKWVETVGRFMPPYFSCDWCDTWVTEVARKLNRISYLSDMYLQHRHPEAGTAPLDQTKLEGYARNEVDHNDVIYRERSAEREAEVLVLSAAMQ